MLNCWHKITFNYIYQKKSPSHNYNLQHAKTYLSCSYTFHVLPFIWPENETVYLNAQDSTTNMFVAVFPESGQIKSLLILLDGFGNSPKDVLFQTDIPKSASQKVCSPSFLF